jgi:hypothetical protein
MRYIELNINERINAKSWVAELCCLVSYSVIKTLVLADDLPDYIRQNISQPCDHETILYRKNWKINRKV